MAYRLRRISDKDGFGNTVSEFLLKLESTRVGRLSRTTPAHLVLYSTINPRMISRLHAEFRHQKGAWYLQDHSLNGTYLNYKRLSTAELLTSGDIICFGHVNGYNIKAGETVPPFKSELKFLFEKTDDDADAVACITAVADSSEKSSEEEEDTIAEKSALKKICYDSSSDHSSSLSSSSSLNDNKAAKKRKSSIGANATLAAVQVDENVEEKQSLLSESAKKRRISRGGAHVARGASRGSNGKSRSSRVEGVTNNASVGDESIEAPKRSRSNVAQSVESYHTVEEPCAAGAICRKPADDDIKWVGCDQCEEWYHLMCTRLNPRLTSRELESLDFVCDRCLDK